MGKIVKNGITYSTFSGASNSAGYVLKAGDTMTGALSITNSNEATSTTSGALKVSGGIGCAKTIRGNKIYGAVWNDYAEYRKADNNKQPGLCVYENKDGLLITSKKRLQPNGKIVSDTFGFAIGETEECNTPIALIGRVLAFPHGKKNKYHVGDVVCTGPNGTISKMNRLEIILFPDRIVGIVSEIPNYNVWGPEKIPVNERIWINVI